MQYSVSPRLTFRIFGPKPSENVSTRTPTRRAARKWPSSCTKISTPSTNRNARRVVTVMLALKYAILTRRPRPRRDRAPTHPPAARSRLKRRAPGAWSFITRSITAGIPVNPSRPSRKDATATSLAAFSTTGVGGAVAQRPVGQAQAREPVQVRGAEVQTARSDQVQPRQRAVPALGIGAGVLDRQPHVRHAQLCNHRAIGQLHHRVHDRLGVDHHVDRDRPARRTASAPRSPRGPCSSASPNRS